MNKTILRVGFWSGLLAFTFTISYCVVQILQMSGVTQFPLDGILIYGTSLCIVIPFLLEILSLHYTVQASKKFWTHAALIFSILYAMFVTSNYVVQLATVIPAKLEGTGSDIRFLDQTPNSLFWNFDALGYIFMGLTTLVAVPALDKKGVQRWIRIAFISNALVTPLISIVYFSRNFSEDLLFIGFPWAVTAPISMLLLAIHFRKLKKELAYDTNQLQTLQKSRYT